MRVGVEAVHRTLGAPPDAVADGYCSECPAPGTAGCSEWRLPGSSRGWPVTRSAWLRCARSSRPAPVTACKQEHVVQWAIPGAHRHAAGVQVITVAAAARALDRDEMRWPLAREHLGRGV